MGPFIVFRLLFVTVCVIRHSDASCQEDAQCPPACHCDTSKELVDCRNEQMDSVPVLPWRTEVLLMGGNKVGEVRQSDFSYCSSLLVLDLSHNRIQRIASESYIALKKLRSLSLKDNLLSFHDYNSSLPTGIFKDLTELSELRLHNNIWSGCTSYREDLFENKPKLESLSLDSPGGLIPFPPVFSQLHLLKSLTVYGGIQGLENGTLSAVQRLPLQELGLVGGEITIVDVLAFARLPKLKSLDLSNNMKLGLGTNLTQSWLGLTRTPIEKLYLQNVSSYSTNDPTPPITSMFFTHLSETPIVELYLDNNGLISINANFSRFLPRLQKLSLSRNSIFLYIIPLFNDISVMSNLTYLDISFQSLFPSPFAQVTQSLTWGGFRNFSPPQVPTVSAPRGLPILDKQNSWYDYFIFPPRLHTLNASKGLPMMAMRYSRLLFLTETTYMDILDISHNPLGSFTEDIYIHPHHPLHVSYLNFSYCELYHVSVAYSELTLEVFDLSNNNLGDECSREKNGSFLRYTAAVMNSDTIRLSANGIKHLPPDFFTQCPSLQNIYLNNNALRSWNSSFLYAPNISFLDLSDNLLSSLSVDTCKEFTHIASTHPFSVNLRGNPLVCSCFTLYFLKWLDRHRDNVKYLNQTTCDFRNNLTSLEGLTDVIQTLGVDCSSKTILLVVSVLLGILVILIFVSVVLYRHRWDIRYVCLRLTRQRREDQRSSNDDQYAFDAFVAYDHRDLIWVAHSLMTRLESTPHFLRLCVHHRNWLPGPTIEENISKSVEISRKTLVILTKNFLRSGWCELEMQLARMRGLEEGDNVIVVVALEEIALREMSRTLVNLRRSNTWLDWYEYDYDTELFWELLVRALGGSRRERNASSGDVSSREGGAVSSREGGAVASREGGAVSSREGGAVSSREGGAVSLLEGGTVSSREGGAVSLLERCAVSSREGGAVSSREGDAVSSLERGAVSSREGGAVSSREGGAVSSRKEAVSAELRCVVSGDDELLEP